LCSPSTAISRRNGFPAQRPPNSASRRKVYGFDITRIKDRTYVGHGGGYPGNTTQTLIQLDDKVGVIVLTNTNDSNPSDIARQLMATVGQAVAKASASKPATVAWDPTWARFAGLYRGRGGDSHVVLLNQKLVIITPNAPNVDNPVALEPLGGGLPIRRAHGRRRGRGGGAFRGGDWPADADVHR